MIKRTTLTVALLCNTLLPTVFITQEALPRPEQPFKGHIGHTTKDSTPDFSKKVRPPQGTPNILLILTDDIGFGASSTFDEPVSTVERIGRIVSHLDRLSENSK